MTKDEFLAAELTPEFSRAVGEAYATWTGETPRGMELLLRFACRYDNREEFLVQFGVAALADI